MNNYLEIKKVPNGTAVLVLGIASLVLCGLIGLACAIIALILHKKDKELYNSDPEAYELSFKNSNAGRICATIGLILSSIMFLFLIVYLIFVFVIIGSSAMTSGSF
jgi:hypothetical protein